MTTSFRQLSNEFGNVNTWLCPLYIPSIFLGVRSSYESRASYAPFTHHPPWIPSSTSIPNKTGLGMKFQPLQHQPPSQLTSLAKMASATGNPRPTLSLRTEPRSLGRHRQSRTLPQSLNNNSKDGSATTDPEHAESASMSSILHSRWTRVQRHRYLALSPALDMFRMTRSLGV